MNTRNVAGLIALALVGTIGTAAVASRGPQVFTDGIQTTSLTLVNSDGQPVVTLDLSGNNEKPYPGRRGRLHIGFTGTYPSEIEIEPGPDAHPIGNIASEIMQWGPRTADGTGRGRMTASLQTDVNGGLSAILDATTNDASGTVGQKRAPPLCINAGEGVGMYLCLYPADATIDLQSRPDSISTGRIPLKRVIKHLRRIPK
jgi:hypothetical protein